MRKMTQNAAPSTRKTNVKKGAKKKKEGKVLIHTGDSSITTSDSLNDDDDDKMSDEEMAADENAKLLRLLSNPEEALNIKEELIEDKGVVTVCPVCKVETVFVDNTCPSCGYKKRSKGGMDRFEFEDDVFAKTENDYYVNPDDE